MGKNKKKVFNTDSFGVILLLVLTVFAGYMGCNQRFLSNLKEEKVTTNSKNYNRSSYSDYDYDDDYYYDDEYYNNYEDYYWDYNDYDYGYDYSYNNNYNSNPNDNSYNYTGYNNYDGQSYYYDDYYYNDTNKPSIRYTSSDIVYQYESYDPWENVSANHTRFGDVTDFIEIIYNDLDINIPGEYSIVYKACNYPGSIYCRTVTKKVTVKQKEDPNSYNTKAPIWSKVEEKSCNEGSSNCKTNRITKPTAMDPYTKRDLDVTLIDGEVDIYTPGTYVLVYYAVTENGISGTTTKLITIKESNNNNNYNDNYYDDDYNYNNNQQRKYISNHYTSYYDDGIYRGNLTPDYNNNEIVKFIQDYKWTNNVKYTYKCTVENGYGIKGWSLVSTDTSDNHPTIQYNNGGFSGTLQKDDFYCVPGKGCDDDLNKNLGTCKNVGETKQVTRTWVGVYSGSVYTNRQETYSGYVYKYR